MKTITITQRNGTVHNVLVDDDAPEEVFTKKWCVINHKKFYAAREHNGKMILMHRIIINCPPDMDVDHRNGSTLDNRRENLRPATRSQNMANMKLGRTNKSGYKGVSWASNENKWCAYISVKNKMINLGYFKTPEEAHSAYCKKGKEIFGEFFNAG